jgi:hypothetical protein
MTNRARRKARLLQPNHNPPHTLRDYMQGSHVFGAVGSGKTSGPAEAVRDAHLRAGMAATQEGREAPARFDANPVPSTHTPEHPED